MRFLLMCLICWVVGYSQGQSLTTFDPQQPNGNSSEMEFYSSKELNQHRFANSNLEILTRGFLLDMEEEWTSEQLDSFIMIMNQPETNVNKLLMALNCLERTDINYAFEKDSLLFPVLDHYMSAHDDKNLNVPLFILDFDFTRLKSEKREEIDNWYHTASYPQYSQQDFKHINVFHASFFADTIRNKRIHLYWDQQTYLTNTSRTITSVKINIGSNTYDLSMGEKFDLSSFLLEGALNEVGITVIFSDGSQHKRNCSVYFTNKPPRGEVIDTKSGSYFTGEFDFNSHTAYYHVYYGCDNNTLRKPFIIVAGWGPYVNDFIIGNTINIRQGWPTNPSSLYHQFNQEQFLDSLRLAGFDVVMVRFTPPNASIHKNVEKLKLIINWINEQKVLNGSYEENILLGYSAGAMCVRLALQQMEKEHLEENGPHPHTKLYVSFDGEHLGAHVPLGVQKAVEYLHAIQYYRASSEARLNIYALYRILNAPLSKELLYYFNNQTGNSNNPSQGSHPARHALIMAHAYANHSKNSHNPGFPGFNRNISVSNGMNESNYENNLALHFPFPKQFGHKLFFQQNDLRRWNVEFNIPGGNTVFRYQIQKFGWKTIMEAKTSSTCLVLDNAAGGMVFVKDNPLTHVIKWMKKTIFPGHPAVFNPHTQFCFTPMVFTHNIKNLTASNGILDYSLKENQLMFQSTQHVYDYNHSNYWGYPHLAHPTNHYSEFTPFDALFSWNENTEHITFNTCTRSDPDNHNEEWHRVDYDAVVGTKRIQNNFLFNEADYVDAYIQNKRYGWNARSNYNYRAEIVVPGEIFAGEVVTQRTNFKPVEVLPNANITFKAEEAIHLMPGFEVKIGAQFHAVIAPYHCDFSIQNSMVNLPTSSNSDGLFQEGRSAVVLGDELNKKVMQVYPNPSEGTLHLLGADDLEFSYEVIDISGKIVKSGRSMEKLTIFQLTTGIYIIKIHLHENTEIHKLVVH